MFHEFKLRLGNLDKLIKLDFINSKFLKKKNNLLYL